MANKNQKNEFEVKLQNLKDYLATITDRTKDVNVDAKFLLSLIKEYEECLKEIEDISDQMHQAQLDARYND